MDHVLPAFVQVQPESSTITFRGGGIKEFPFSVRHDIGRIVAYTFKQPAAYKNEWLTIANGWYSLGEIAQLIEKQSGMGFKIQSLELNDSVPVLRVLEVNDLDIFDRNGNTPSVPLQLTDMKELFKWPVPYGGK